MAVGAIYKSMIPENLLEHAVHTCQQTELFLLEKNSFEPWLPKHTENSFLDCVTSIKSKVHRDVPPHSEHPQYG